MVVDLPPGTGDAYLAILQKLKIDESFVVTTSQSLALADTIKGMNLMLKFNIPITGIIENMSFFKCDNCDKSHYIFGKNNVENLAKQFNTKVVAKLPIFNNSKESLIFSNSDNTELHNVVNNLVSRL